MSDYMSGAMPADLGDIHTEQVQMAFKARFGRQDGTVGDAFDDQLVIDRAKKRNQKKYQKQKEKRKEERAAARALEPLDIPVELHASLSGVIAAPGDEAAPATSVKNMKASSTDSEPMKVAEDKMATSSTVLGDVSSRALYDRQVRKAEIEADSKYKTASTSYSTPDSAATVQPPKANPQSVPWGTFHLFQLQNREHVQQIRNLRKKLEEAEEKFASKNKQFKDQSMELTNTRHRLRGVECDLEVSRKEVEELAGFKARFKQEAKDRAGELQQRVIAQKELGTLKNALNGLTVQEYTNFLCIKEGKKYTRMIKALRTEKGRWRMNFEKEHMTSALLSDRAIELEFDKFELESKASEFEATDANTLEQTELLEGEDDEVEAVEAGTAPEGMDSIPAQLEDIQEVKCEACTDLSKKLDNKTMQMVKLSEDLSEVKLELNNTEALFRTIVDKNIQAPLLNSTQPIRGMSDRLRATLLKAQEDGNEIEVMEKTKVNRRPNKLRHKKKMEELAIAGAENVGVGERDEKSVVETGTEMEENRMEVEKKEVSEIQVSKRIKVNAANTEITTDTKTSGKTPVSFEDEIDFMLSNILSKTETKASGTNSTQSSLASTSTVIRTVDYAYKSPLVVEYDSETMPTLLDLPRPRSLKHSSRRKIKLGKILKKGLKMVGLGLSNQMFF